MSTRRDLSALFSDINRDGPLIPADWPEQLETARRDLTEAAADHDAGLIDLNT